MNFYDRWVLPTILDLVMRQTQLEKYRREVVGAATGLVLEVDVGLGLELPILRQAGRDRIRDRPFALVTRNRAPTC